MNIIIEFVKDGEEFEYEDYDNVVISPKEGLLGAVYDNIMIMKDSVIIVDVNSENWNMVRNGSKEILKIYD